MFPHAARSHRLGASNRSEYAALRDSRDSRIREAYLARESLALGYVRFSCSSQIAPSASTCGYSQQDNKITAIKPQFSWREGVHTARARPAVARAVRDALRPTSRRGVACWLASHKQEGPSQRCRDGPNRSPPSAATATPQSASAPRGRPRPT